MSTATYVHVQLLSVALGAINDGSDDDELIFRDKVPDASFVLRRLVSRVCSDVEFERRGRLKIQQNQQKAEISQKHLHVSFVSSPLSSSKFVPETLRFLSIKGKQMGPFPFKISRKISGGALMLSYHLRMNCGKTVTLGIHKLVKSK